jgi:hypothetical protein
MIVVPGLLLAVGVAVVRFGAETGTPSIAEGLALNAYHPDPSEGTSQTMDAPFPGPIFCPVKVKDVWIPALDPSLTSFPGKPHSDSAEAGRDLCWVPAGAFGIDFALPELNGWNRAMLPEWIPVDRHGRLDTLNGKVDGFWDPNNMKSEWPHIAFEDLPVTHLTHDFAFQVKPDPGSERLLGYQVQRTWQDPCSNERSEYRDWTVSPPGTPLQPGLVERLMSPDCEFVRVFHGDQVSRQADIEVEWESGIGANDDGNPCTAANEIGNSCGFYTDGHKRRQPIWNFPTIDDHVTVIGNWIWDRGHPPAKTEIHPPRLVVVERKLPVVEPAHALLATRADVLANGDGGALIRSSNDPSLPGFITTAHMGEFDYGFDVAQQLPRPAGATLRYTIVRRPGDTFTAPIPPARFKIIRGRPDSPGGLPGYHFTIPWRSAGVADERIFARSVYLWWAKKPGVPQHYHYRVYRVTLDRLLVYSTQDGLTDGEYRVLADVAGNYLFLNEVVRDPHILSDGIGDTGGAVSRTATGELVPTTWNIVDRRRPESPHYSFDVIVPENDGRFRVHAGGWEADGVNDAFGHLVNMNQTLDVESLHEQLGSTLFRAQSLEGCQDDPIGEVNEIEPNGPIPGGKPMHRHPLSKGQASVSEPVCGDSSENGNYRLEYTIEFIHRR